MLNEETKNLRCSKFINDKLKPQEAFGGLSSSELKDCVNQLCSLYQYSQILESTTHSFDLSKESRILAFLLFRKTNNYWYLHLYARALKNARLQKFILYLLKKYPDNHNNYILVNKISCEFFLKDVYFKLPPPTSKIFSTPSWGAIELSKKLISVKKFQFALTLITSKIYRESSTSLKLEALRIRFEIANIFKKFNDSTADDVLLRIAMTIAFIDPNYGFITKIFDEVLTQELIHKKIEITRFKSNFINDQTSILMSGTDIDFGLQLIYQLVDRNWLNTEELLRLKLFESSIEPIPSEEELIFPGGVISVSSPKFWTQLNNVNPSTYQLVAEESMKKRAELRMGKFLNPALIKKRSTALLSSTGEVHRNYSFGRANFYSHIPIKSPIFHPGKTALIMQGYGEGNWCHFLLDRLPLTQTILSKINNVNAIAIDEKSTKWLIEFLFLKAIEVPVIPIKDGIQYVFEELYCFTPTQHPCQLFPDVYIDFYKSFCKPDSKNQHRIFIKRPLGRRGILNHHEVSLVLKKYNFIEIELESLSIENQIKIFNEADFVIGCHGAGLSNLVFSKPGTKIIELSHRGYLIPTYSILANRLNHVHSILLDESFSFTPDPVNKFLDLSINPCKLEKLIENLILKSH